VSFVYFFAFLSVSAAAQTEVMAWGNLTGIRIEGQLIEFETSFRVVETNWTWMSFTGKERNATQFNRNGSVARVSSSVMRISFEQTVEDKDRGTALVSLSYQSDTTRRVEGVYYCFELPAKRYASGTVNIGNTTIPFAGLSDDNRQVRKATGRQIVIGSPGRKIRINFSSSVNTFVRKEDGNVK